MAESRAEGVKGKSTWFGGRVRWLLYAGLSPAVRSLRSP